MKRLGRRKFIKYLFMGFAGSLVRQVPAVAKGPSMEVIDVVLSLPWKLTEKTPYNRNYSFGFSDKLTPYSHVTWLLKEEMGVGKTIFPVGTKITYEDIDEWAGSRYDGSVDHICIEDPARQGKRFRTFQNHSRDDLYNKTLDSYVTRAIDDCKEVLFHTEHEKTMKGNFRLVENVRGLSLYVIYADGLEVTIRNEKRLGDLLDCLKRSEAIEQVRQADALTYILKDD